MKLASLIGCQVCTVLALALALVPLAARAQTSPFVTYTPTPPAPPTETVSDNLSKTQLDPFYATLYGGADYDELLDHVVKGDYACMVGVTGSPNLILFNPIQETNAGGFDGWIACGEVATGMPLFATFLGSEGEETITGVDIYNDTLFAVGITTSSTMPGADGTYQSSSGGSQDCFISRMSVMDGSGLKTTFFGREGQEFCSDIAVGRDGVWIGGTTDNVIDLVNPLQSELRGSSDMLLGLVKRDLSALRFATLLGGDNEDGAERIAVSRIYDEKVQTKVADGSTVSPPSRISLAGWSRGPGGPVTDNAWQKTHGGGIDLVLASYIYDVDIDLAQLEYYGYGGRSGDEVPRDFVVSRHQAWITGWSTSPEWNTLGRPRIAGPSDGFLYVLPTFTDTMPPTISYVGPSDFYNLPLAVSYTRPGVAAVGGFADIPSTGNAFMQALDRDYSVIGSVFAGGNAPADFNKIQVSPFYWAGGGKTGQQIPTTQMAIQSTYGGGDYDAFGTKFRTPWGYSTFFNATNDELAAIRNGQVRDPIAPRSPGRVDALGWDLSYQYSFSGGGRNYNIDRLLDESSDVLNYTYLFSDRALTVSVPQVEHKEVGILAYNELGRSIDIVRLDQSTEHNELKRTTVEADQFFFVNLMRDQNLRITDGLEFIDYRLPMRKYHASFPYLSGILQAESQKSSIGQPFSLVLYDAQGQSIELPVTTAAESPEAMPEGMALLANHPNPFNTTTTLNFEIPETSRVQLTVFDVMGRRVRTLLDDVRTAGAGSMAWDGRSETGHRMASGTYLVRLKVGDRTLTRTLVIAR